MSALNLEGLTDAQLRLFVVRCARRVHDPRSIKALDVAERYARGEATDAELAAAWDAAWNAATLTAAAAAEAAGWAAARGGAWDEAAAAAWAAAWDAAWAAERAEQQKILGEIREVKP